MFWILTLPLWLLLDLWRPSLADAFMTPKLQTTIAAAKTMLSGVIGRSVCKRVMASPAKIKVSFSRCLHTSRKPAFPVVEWVGGDAAWKINSLLI